MKKLLLTVLLALSAPAFAATINVRTEWVYNWVTPAACSHLLPKAITLYEHQVDNRPLAFRDIDMTAVAEEYRRKVEQAIRKQAATGVTTKVTLHEVCSGNDRYDAVAKLLVVSK